MDYFCVMPWYSFESYAGYHGITSINQNRICCSIDGLVDRKILQNQFLNNEKPQCCNKCWYAEENGFKSRRQLENEFLDYLLDRDIEKIEEDVLNGKSNILIYQIQTSNVCNAACTTCGSSASSTWAKFEKLLGKESRPIFNNNIDNISVIDYHSAKAIRLQGGEPFLDKNTFKILETLLNHNNNTCYISILTNGSIKMSKEKIELLKNFTNIDITFSIDGIGKAFDYLRFPLKWNEILDNLFYTKQNFNNVGISFVHSNLNDHLLTETIDWFNQHNFPYFINRPSSHSVFHPDVKPGHTRWTNFSTEILNQDRVKGIHIKDYIPYVWKLMKQNT